MNIRLRELRKSDSEKYFEWINKRELVLLNSAYTPVSEFSHNKWFDSISENKLVRIFSIVASDKNEKEWLIGSCSLRNIDSLNRSAELQIRIGEENFRGKGLGTSAIKNLIEFGFNDLNLNRIYLEVFEENKIAISVYKKCGFVKEGVKRESAFVNGKKYNIVLMSILRKEFIS